MIPSREPVAGQEAEEEVLTALWFKLRTIEETRADGSGRELCRVRCEGYHYFAAAGGTWNLVIDGRLLKMSAGQVLLAAPGQFIEAANIQASAGGQLYRLRFDIWREPGVIDDGETDWQGRLPLGQVMAVPVAAALCKEMTIAMERGRTQQLGMLEAQAVFYQFLHAVWQPSGTGQAALADVKLLQVKEYLERHYDEDIAVEQLAAAAGMSYRHFVREFKRRFGRNAIEFVTERRMNRAKHLLETTDMRVKDIARQAGYADELYFRRKFTRHVGMPPAVYADNRKCRVAAYSYYHIGLLQALKIVPYAAPLDHWWTDYYHRKFEFDVKVPLAHDFDFNYEALRQASPDRILAFEEMMPEAERLRLAQIAPTLFVSWTRWDWRRQLRAVAQFLDKSAAAEEWLDAYERKVQHVRGLLAEVIRGRSILAVRLDGSQLYVYGRRNIGAVLHEDLRFECPELAGGAMPAAIEPAQLAACDPDWLLVMVSPQQTAQEHWQAMRRSEDWLGLTAVRQGRMLRIAEDPWVEYTAYNHFRILDQLPSLFGRKRP